MRHLTCAAISVAACLVGAPVLATTYTLIELGELPGGVGSTGASAINDLGQVVGRSRTATGDKPFLWDMTNGMVELMAPPETPGDPAPELGIAIAVNNAGQVLTSGDSGAYLWQPGNVATNLSEAASSLSDRRGGAELGFVRDINDAGQFVGVADFPEAIGSAFIGDVASLAAPRPQRVGPTPIGDLGLGTVGSMATAINATGQVLGIAQATTGGRAFLWESGGGAIDLGDLTGGADNSSASDINNLGQVVGASGGATGNRAFLWQSGVGMISLGDVEGGSNGSQARAINDAGSSAPCHKPGGRARFCGTP